MSFIIVFWMMTTISNSIWQYRLFMLLPVKCNNTLVATQSNCGSKTEALSKINQIKINLVVHLLASVVS